jgi:hypothetical protein
VGVRTGIVVVVAALAAAAGCSSDAPAAPPKVPNFSTSTAASASSQRPVPKSCGGVATLAEVTDILQVAVTGQTLPVVGVPEPKIGRIARIDCYYGVPAGQPLTAAPVSIGLASYSDDASARKRMTSTVSDEKDAGAKANDVPVGPDRGVLLNSTKHTLVAARGNNTVVVSVVLDLIHEDQAGSLIGRLADRALSPR